MTIVLSVSIGNCLIWSMHAQLQIMTLAVGVLPGHSGQCNGFSCICHPGTIVVIVFRIPLSAYTSAIPVCQLFNNTPSPQGCIFCNRQRTQCMSLFAGHGGKGFTVISNKPHYCKRVCQAAHRPFGTSGCRRIWSVHNELPWFAHAAFNLPFRVPKPDLAHSLQTHPPLFSCSRASVLQGGKSISQPHEVHDAGSARKAVLPVRLLTWCTCTIGCGLLLLFTQPTLAADNALVRSMCSRTVN